MIAEKMIKKVLRKWLKKKLYNDNLPLATNIARFEWVYSSPLIKWRDRIWVVRNCTKDKNRCLEEYLHR